MARERSNFLGKFLPAGRDGGAFTIIRLSLASPDVIKTWSRGEVKKPETINYRTFKPERDGLFCERIFGPVKSWECSCGKYKKLRHKDIICDRCGVEVVDSKVRRDRMGHIELAAPVAHVWFVRSVPSRMAVLLGMSGRELEKVIYYEQFIVIDPGKTGLKRRQLLSEAEYRKIQQEPFGRTLKAKIGAEAVRDMLREIDLGRLSRLIQIAMTLSVPVDEMELRVAHEEAYVVFDPGKAGLKRYEIISDKEFREITAKEPQGKTLKAKTGDEAIRDLWKEADAIQKTKEKKDISSQKMKELMKRMRVVESFRRSGNRPESMIMDVLPVLPPDLRPLVPLDGGRFATSDLNDLYRRVINRNNRLRRLIEIKAPEIIIQNEKRMLQESTDALFENGRGGHVVKGAGNRPLKSLSDMLKGKQGRFRQNLLGKRVDYSGRSVIVVGPDLKLHECGLPKEMALELFKPFIIQKLEERGYVHTIKSAKKLVERSSPEVWDVLEEVIEEHPVLLNRAPTLHRLGIQAFLPVLVEGKAIQIHPLVCTAFNADFDGDQMAVHVPLSVEAQLEARVLMMSTNNILSPSNGHPIVSPTQDMVLGCYYLTGNMTDAKYLAEAKDESGALRPLVHTMDEVERVHAQGAASLHTRVRIRFKDKLIDTTVGRVIFNLALMPEMRFMNKQIGRRELNELVAQCYAKYGSAQTIRLLDTMKRLGFEYATRGGVTVSLDDMLVPPEKEKIVGAARKEVNDVNSQYQRNIITERERYNRVIDIWTQATNRVSTEMMGRMKADQSGFNPIFMMATSGARGKEDQVRQLAGMRGLMARPQQRITGGIGEIIENPIVANFREGLSVLEYFISTHGARKGLADTALKTADAGYLTRRIVDVAQDVKIIEEDCGTIKGIGVEAMRDGADIIEPLRERITGRVALDSIVDPETDEVYVTAGELISDEASRKIEESGIFGGLRIRSVLTCESKGGVCAKCYGRDLATGRLVSIGEAVGVIAGQSIGEPGTQLTLRTFHVGGAASRIIEQSRIECRNDGLVQYSENMRILRNRSNEIIAVNRSASITLSEPPTAEGEPGRELESHDIPYGAVIKKENGSRAKKGELLAMWDPYTVSIFAEKGGTVRYRDIVDGVTMQEEVDRETKRVERRIIDSKEGRHPQIFLENEQGSPIAYHSIPVGADLAVNAGDEIQPGDVLAKLPREGLRTGDITGGLPRVAELFEARRPKNCAIISDIEGTVKFVEQVKGARKYRVIPPKGEPREYLIPIGRHIDVRDGDKVRPGEPLTDGLIDPHDVLRVNGEEAVQEYLLNKIQEVYRLQGVSINDKHIEAIIRQMLRKVVILDPGDTEFLYGQQVDKVRFKEENARVFASKEKLRPAQAKTILLGITKASLSTESFVSAASFQETTRVLAEAAVNGAVDKLSGLKENVIMGHLISAGTGLFDEKEILLDLPKELETPETTEAMLVARVTESVGEPAPGQSESAETN